MTEEETQFLLDRARHIILYPHAHPREEKEIVLAALETLKRETAPVPPPDAEALRLQELEGRLDKYE